MPTVDHDANDHLRAAVLDLERLQSLLADACDTLLARFAATAAALRAADVDAAAALRELEGAVTGLQFQDLAQQLIAHTRGALSRLAEETGCAPLDSAGPVAQAGVDAGSVELF